MNQGSITIDIRGNIVGYEESLRQLKDAVSKIDPGSAIGKKLSTAISNVEKQILSLSKNLTHNLTSDRQIDNTIAKINNIGLALQQVSTLVEKVKVTDLNFDILGIDFENFKEEIDNLGKKLREGLDSDIKKVISSSTDLQNVFKNILHINTDDLSYQDILKTLKQSSIEAKQQVEEVDKEVKRLQQDVNRQQINISQKEQGLFGTIESRDNIKNQAEEIKKQYDEIFSQLRENFSKNLSEKLVGTTINQEELINSFFQGLTPETLRSKIESLYDSLKNAGLYTRKVDFYNEIFGGGRDINQVIKQIVLGDPQPIIEHFKTFLSQIAAGIGRDKEFDINKLIDINFEQAFELMEKAIDAGSVNTLKALDSSKQKLTAKMAERDQALARQETVKSTQETIDSTLITLQNEVKRLVQENVELRQKIKELAQQKNTEITTKKEDIVSTGAQAKEVSTKFLITTEQANKYKDALEQVKEKEEAIGRLKGVVERWFSIYAAIRMVGQAYDSIKNTLKELDTTITEISIVTDMNQKDLWGQMDSYTALARSYASSISGVYKVSQLFYQQGLQSAEVMKLTEQTLKMARISGLDYATATDYMTNAIRSFKMEMEEAQRVVDVYSAVAAKSATDTTELASAMSKTASSAEAVGSSFENTTAMMAVMIEATRESAENIGSALKSIISRYGEMKADPTALVDSEGQAMSLNKVDTALQSVGISIHDVSGQFRDFDDVIMELAANWTKIDKNTQRYIATIMAGNRQQSRFLALVSSYDRLKELSEDAANSEDAAQLQFLKTLDSIDAKTQQLQTSLQALYVDTGLENVYKHILDIGTNIINTYAEMPRIFNYPIPAITKFASQFINLGMVAVNAFKIIKAHWSQQQNELTLINKVASQERISIEEAEAFNAINRTKNMYKDLKKVHIEGQEEITDVVLTGEETRASAKSTMTANNKKMYGAMATSLGGAVISTIAANMDDGTQRGGKAALTGISAVLQGAGTGLMVGGPWGALIGALSALPGIIETIGIAVESTEEKITRLNAELEEATNQRIIAKDELKTLEDYGKKYQELYKARNDSNEAYQSYIDLNNEIANKHPELIKGIDAEGNYIIELTKDYYDLLEAKRKAYSDAFVEEGKAQITKAQDKDTILKQLNINLSKGEISEFEQALPYISLSRIGLLFSDKVTGEHNYEKEMETRLSDYMRNFRPGKKAEQSLYNVFTSASTEDWENGTGRLLIQAGRENSGNYATMLKTVFGENISGSDPEQLYIKLSQFIGSFIDHGQSLQDINDAIQEVTGQKGNFNTELYNSIEQLKNSVEYRENYVNNIIKSLNTSMVGQSLQGLEQDIDDFQAGWANEQIKQQWETYKEDWAKLHDIDPKDENALRPAIRTIWEDFSNEINFRVGELFSSEKDLYINLTEEEKKQINELYKNAGQYTTNDIDTILSSINDVDNQIKDTIKVHIDDIGSSTITRFKTGISELALNNKDLSDEISAFSELNFGSAYLEGIYENVKNTINSGAENVNEQLDLLAGIYANIGGLDVEARRTAMNIIDRGDMTSLTGLYEIMNQLSKENLDSLIDPIKALTNFIDVNLVTEFESLTQQMTSQLEDFDKAISKAAKGMDLKDAIEMADRIGVSVAQFKFKDGKYFYDNIEAIQESYYDFNNELINHLKSELSIKLDTMRTNGGSVEEMNELIRAYDAMITATQQYSSYQVFEGMRSSLEEVGNECENITKTMGEIRKLEKELNNNPNNKQVKERLELFQKIAMVQMQDPDQYDFMGRKLPDYLKGPENYWDSIGSAFNAMNEAAEEGYMGIADFYNIVNEMNNLALLSGDKIKFLGVELNGDLESASALIEKGFSALSNVEGKGAKIKLSEFGASFSGGADDMASNVQQGIKAMAQSQIDMLDSMIALMETVVAMENLGDIDVNKNGIDFAEMFENVGFEDSEESLYFATEKMQFFSKKILENAENNDDLNKALDLISFNSISLKKMLENINENAALDKEEAEEYFAALTSLYEMFSSGNYDLDNLMESITDIASKSGFSGEVQIGKSKLSIGMGVVLQSNEEGQYEVEGETYTDPQTAIKAYTLSQLGKVSEPIESTDNSVTANYKINDEVTIEVSANPDGTFEYNGESYDTIRKVGEQLYEDYGGDGENAEDFAVRIGMNAEILADKITINEEVFKQATHDKIVELSKALSSNDTDNIINAAEQVGINVEITGSLTEEQRNQIAELAGIESKTVVVDVEANFNGVNGEALGRLLSSETPVKVELAAKGDVLQAPSIDTQTVETQVKLTYDSITKELLENSEIIRKIKLIADSRELQKSLTTLNTKIKVNTVNPTQNTETSTVTPVTVAPKVVMPKITYTSLLTGLDEVLSIIVTKLKNTFGTFSPELKIRSRDAGAIGTAISIQNRINRLSTNILVKADTKPFVDAINALLEQISDITISIPVTTTNTPSTQKNINFEPKAAGNVALASGRTKTLMGELGPELVVSHGRYFVVGQNGAEMVDLEPDAIVFNHLQTKQLLTNGTAGRGTPITNERNAISMATGNVTGPALASAAAALSALKQIRAMWQSMLDASLKDLGQQAGSGGKGSGSGGGGGGSGSSLDPGFIADLERWYNLLRQIARLEKDINYEEKLRSKLSNDLISNGKAYYESQKRSLEALNQQIAKNQDLSALQKSYYDQRRADLSQTQFGKIFTFNENGLMQYNDAATMANGDKGGLFALAKINAQNPDGSAVYTAREQYNLLRAWGFGDNELKYTDEGKLIEWTDEEGKPREEAYTEAVQAFWDKVDGWKDELDSLYDSYTGVLNDVLDEETARNQILREIQENQLSLEQKILSAIEKREQEIIDNLQEEKEELKKTTEAYLDGLNKQLENEKKMYQKQEQEQNLDKLRRQLAILQRSGGSDSQIRSLQNEIRTKEQDAYFNAQQEQIDTIKEASDKEIERLDQQVEILKETLEYQKEHGLLWNEVSQIMQESPEQIMEFLMQWSPELQALSALGQETTMQEIKSLIEQYVARRDDANNPIRSDGSNEAKSGWERYAAQIRSEFTQVWTKDNIDRAKKAYLSSYSNDSDPNKAAAAARRVFDNAIIANKVNSTSNKSSAMNVNTSQQPVVVREYKYINNSKHEVFDVTKDIKGNILKRTSVGTENHSIATITGTPIKRCTKCGYQTTGATVKTSFAGGGEVKYTGLAMVHGSPQAPETVLNAAETKVWKNDILSGKNGSFTNSILALNALVNSTLANHADRLSNNSSNDNSITIEHAEVNMNATIANDYDARRAGQNALEEMVKIARKTGTQSVTRRLK